MATAGVIGAGLIGRSWAMVFARAGWDVRITDVSADARKAAPGLMASALAEQAKHGLVRDAQAAAARITVVDTLAEAAKAASLVQECGPETLEAKSELFAALDKAAPEGAILASSSSALVASLYTEKLPGRARCLVAHPVNPPHLVPIVELCPAPWTSKEVMAKARAIYEDVGQSPITMAKEIDGFILNRMQGALVSEAMRLVGEGYVSAEDLDKTISHGLGLRWSFMGPFETIEMNAPGGIPDYSARYGMTVYRRYLSNPISPDVWDKPNVEKVMQSWGKRPSREEIAEKTRWRDERLAALAAFKQTQKGFEAK